MWADILNWWKCVLGNSTVVPGAIAGFLSAFVMFVVAEVLWRTAREDSKLKREIRRNRLRDFYAPLYQFYREAYSRFDSWQKENPSTRIIRQPFFEEAGSEAVVESVFTQHSDLASQGVVELWTEYRATKDKAERSKRRQQMISCLVKEYHQLRKDLHLDYNGRELVTGEFMDGVGDPQHP